MAGTRPKLKGKILNPPASWHPGSAGFKHKPFVNPQAQIRLLMILPGDPDEVIRLTSDVFCLKSPPHYKAISYTWGNEENPKTVYVDDEPLKVRDNCHHVLWQARLHFPGSWIWIDSICIDQSNDEEKSCQVQMMWHIYRCADLVLSCVGPHAGNSELIVEAAQEILELLLVEYAHSEERDYEFDHMAWASARGESYFVALQSAYENFSERPYWSRLWIIQEMRASGKGCDRGLRILCGQDSLELWALSALDLFMASTLKKVIQELSWSRLTASGMRDSG